MKNIEGWIDERICSKLSNFDESPAELNPTSANLRAHFLVLFPLSDLLFLLVLALLMSILSFTTFDSSLDFGLKNVQTGSHDFCIFLDNNKGFSCFLVVDNEYFFLSD